MSVLDVLFNRGGKFFTLLEDAAREIIETVEDFSSFMETPSTSRHQEILARRESRESNITHQLEEELLKTYLTELERADIMYLSDHLNKVPRSFAYMAKLVHASGVFANNINISKQIIFMEHCSEIILAMVRELRNPNSTLKIRQLSRKILRYQDRASDDRLGHIIEIYGGKFSDLEALILRDIYQMCLRIMDQFESVSSLIVFISLKNY